MRILVILLLILNIGFAAWQVTSARQHAAVARLAPADPGVEPLRLLSEVAAPSPAAPPQPPVSVPTPAPQPTPPPVTQSTAPPTPPASQTHTACYTVGPLPDTQQAEQLMQRLNQKGIAGQQRMTETRSTGGYRVILPPLPSKESAQRVARQLAAKGVTDYQVGVDDNQRDIISLGVYKDQQAATRRQAQVDALGYASRVEPREIVTQSYWLDTQASDTPADVWTALLAGYPQAQRQERSCP